MHRPFNFFPLILFSKFFKSVQFFCFEFQYIHYNNLKKAKIENQATLKYAQFQKHRVPQSVEVSYVFKDEFIKYHKRLLHLLHSVKFLDTQK